MSEPALCIYEQCERPRSDRIREPLCAHHARRVYLQVKELMEGAGWREMSQAARPPQQGGRKPAHYTSQVGQVYFARCGDLIKIGFSTNLKQRLRDIGADELLLSFEGTREKEKNMHAAFGPSWSHGEYFHPTPALLDYIAGKTAKV